jgi:hypothetical protein
MKGKPAMASDWTQVGNSSTELKIFFVALSLVVLAVVIWAVFIRNPDTEKRPQHHWKTAKNSEASATEGGKRRRHRRRRKDRPRNPTLAETGGLPSARDHRLEPPPHSN